MDRLKQLGRWIKTNTEAVYGTRMLPPYAQKETGTCYTRSQDARYAYVICKRWPGVSLSLEEVCAQPNSEIRMLGVSTPLAWKQDARSLVINVPEALQVPDNRPCKYAWVFKIPMQPKVCLEPDPFRHQITFKTIGEIDQIRYTLDGAEPTDQSALANGPVALPASSTLTVKARAFRGGNPVGRVASTAVTTPPPVPPKPAIWLDELDPAKFITGWQAAGVKTWRNVNCHGNPLKVQGQEFRRGIGLHANAEVVFPLAAEWARFVCRVGIDDRAEGQGSIRVKLFLDNSLRAETPILTGKDGLWNIDLTLRESGEQAPAKALRIVVEDNGDGIMGDNADFVDAGFLGGE